MRELVETVRRNVSIDWTAKETVRAKLRAMVRRVLRKHGYPPDTQEKATQTVLAQAILREESTTRVVSFFPVSYTQLPCDFELVLRYRQGFRASGTVGLSGFGFL